jgi:hypothetical protein
VRLRSALLAATLVAASTSAALAATTPVGSVLKIGAPATVTYSNSISPKVTGTVQVTPLSIVKGSIKDFANITLTGAQKTSTPYYVRVRAKNVGKTDLSKTDPARYLDGVDDRSQSQTPVIFFGTFAKCPDPLAPAHLKPGQSYETCETFLIPKGGSIVGAVWITFDPKHPSKSNILWKR